LPRLDWPFLIAAVLGTAAAGRAGRARRQPASAALLVLGFALGAAFLKAEFSFTAAWRRFPGERRGRRALRALLLIAVRGAGDRAGRALVPGFGGAIAPIGPSLVIGAFVFGSACSLRTAAAPARSTPAGGGSGAC
jgi:hypothetical protein